MNENIRKLLDPSLYQDWDQKWMASILDWTHPPTKDIDERHQNYLVRFSKRTHLQAGVPVVMEMQILSALAKRHIIAFPAPSH